MTDCSTMTRRDSWLTERTGAYLLRQERAVLAEALPTIFGYFLVQVGMWGPAGGLLHASPIRAQFVLAPEPDTAPQVRTEPEALPLATDSVDAMLLPHTLEHARDPHCVLREAERVMVGEAHLVILGFHPWGCWALRQRAGAPTPWAGHYVGVRRLREWLAVLGFNTVSVRHYLFRPPLARGLLVRSAFLDHWRWRITAGAYMLVACKRVYGVTPLRLRRAMPKRAFADVANPTVR
ncbi:MAG: methyltransferase domain-containing protein [Gammaproteobacteria bacterium]|nr:methyltransferase domain-containing protein [Gammaproteobacteria bacterium]